MTKAFAASISVHDVMPSTLCDVAGILALLESHGIQPAPLLVVPGLGWTADRVATLRRWQDAGHELVGHGWMHHVDTIRGVRHGLHSLMFSRDVAEHLALDAAGIVGLVKRCHAWFAANGLTAPRRYVPPAWALGTIPRTALADLPFRTYEVLSGDIDARTGRLRRSALVGFEADTWVRARALRAWNRLNCVLARRSGVPLRIAIHPRDLTLKLCRDLRSLIIAAGEHDRAIGCVANSPVR